MGAVEVVFTCVKGVFRGVMRYLMVAYLNEDLINRRFELFEELTLSEPIADDPAFRAALDDVEADIQMHFENRDVALDEVIWGAFEALTPCGREVITTGLEDFAIDSVAGALGGSALAGLGSYFVIPIAFDWIEGDMIHPNGQM